MKCFNLAILLSISLFSIGAEARETIEVRVMSYNVRIARAADGINHWEKRKDDLVEVIRKDAPDFIGLQEAERIQMDYIRKKLPEYAEVGLGTAILYRKKRFSPSEFEKFWLSDTPEKSSITWGNAYLRFCVAARFTERKTKRSFYLYNTHLDNVSQFSRMKSVALISKRIQSRKYKEPYVLIGDFNAGEDNPAIRYLLEKGQENSPIEFFDAFRELYPKETVVGTFNEFKNKTTGDKIDYVFIGPKIKTINAAILKERIADGRNQSDHFPVVTQLQIGATTQD